MAVALTLGRAAV